MNILTGKLAEAYECLSRASRVGYADAYLISNQILSKNPFTNTFLNNFIKGNRVVPHSRYSICRKLVMYYIKSILHFFIYLFEFGAYYMSGIHFKGQDEKEQFIVLDTFFLVDRIIEEGEYRDPYLPDLDKVLKQLDKAYVYLPVFSGRGRPWKILKVLEILRKQNVPTITEYELLSVTDLARIAIFILSYPFHVMRFRRNFMKCTGSGKPLLAFELIESLDDVTFYDYGRLLQGRNIGNKLSCRNIKIIGWCENQTVHKNFYKGCKDNNSNIVIYGAQLFLYSAVELNVTIDEGEQTFSVNPDKILKNGVYYIPERTGLKYGVGPSLRYSRIFSAATKIVRERNVLVLLPYYEMEAANILSLLESVELPGYNFLIKFHPAQRMDSLTKMLPPGASLVEGDVYDLFGRARLAVGSLSGSLLEAATVGVPVVFIRNPLTFEYSLFPELGKGIVWDEAVDAWELKRKIETFLADYDRNYPQRAEISKTYKNMLYCEPTAGKIAEAFDLAS